MPPKAAPKPANTAALTRLSILQTQKAALQPTRSFLNTQLTVLPRISSPPQQAQALFLRRSLLDVNVQLASIMHELNNLEWQSTVIDKAQFVEQEKQRSDLKKEIKSDERKIEQFGSLLTTETGQTNDMLIKIMSEADERTKAVDSLIILKTSTQEPATSVETMCIYQRPVKPDTPCGPQCSQNVAYNQPFLPSLAMGASRTVPECLLHRPDIPFIQKLYTIDEVRNQGAVNFWTLCRESEVKGWACPRNMQTSSEGSASTTGSRPIVTKKRRQNKKLAMPQKKSVARKKSISRKEPPNDQVPRKFTIPSIRDLLSGKARGKVTTEGEAKAEVLDTKQNFQLRKQKKTTTRKKTKSRPSLLSPTPILSPQMSPPLAQGVMITKSLKYTSNGGSDEISHINPHLNFGLGHEPTHDPTHDPTVGLSTTVGANFSLSLSHAVGRRTNSGSNSSGSADGDLAIPSHARPAAPIYRARTQLAKKSPTKGIRRSVRMKTPKRNDS